MKGTIIAALVFCLSSFAQTFSPVQPVNFSNTTTTPTQVGTLSARPSTCSVGQQYFASDAVAGQNLSTCTATNVWFTPTDTNCAAGSYSLGVDAGGNSKGCTAAATAPSEYPVNVSASGYNAFPGLIQLSSGTVMAVYRHGTSHAADKGVIYAQTSTDNTIWSAPTTVLTDTTYDARDPGISKIANNKCLLSYFLSDWTGPTPKDVYVATSTDTTCTAYTSPVRITTDGSQSSSQVVMSSNGTTGYLGVYGPGGIRVYRTLDSGASFALLSTVTASVTASEPTMVIRANGTFAMMIRDYPVTGQISFASSTDSGATWTITSDVFAGLSRSALYEVNGRLLASYRAYGTQVNATYGFTQMASRTSLDGLTWTQEVFTNHANATTFVYSAMALLSNNVIGQVYCFESSSSEADCFSSTNSFSVSTLQQAPNVDGLVNVGDDTILATDGTLRSRTQTVDRNIYNAASTPGAPMIHDIINNGAANSFHDFRSDGVSDFQVGKNWVSLGFGKLPASITGTDAQFLIVPTNSVGNAQLGVASATANANFFITNWDTGRLNLRTSNVAGTAVTHISIDRMGAITQPGFISNETTFTTSGCSTKFLTGGATAGNFVSNVTGTCAVVITMRGATGLTATNGWTCMASDRTTPTNPITQTDSSTTTCTITGTTVAGDIIQFLAVGN